MLDIKFIRENSDKIKEVCREKGIELDINYLLSLDKKRRELIKKSEGLRFQQKKLGKEEPQIPQKLPTPISHKELTLFWTLGKD